MNEHLIIPEPIQDILDDINDTPLYLAELSMPKHPKLPQFDRFIRVNDIDAKSKNEFIYFSYEQILRDEDTNEIVNISLPTPEWVIYKDTWSSLRNETNQTIQLEFVNPENSVGLDPLVKVPSYKYMLWLMKNDKAGLLELITSYLDTFKQFKLTELNKV